MRRRKRVATMLSTAKPSAASFPGKPSSGALAPDSIKAHALQLCIERKGRSTKPLTNTPGNVSHILSTVMGYMMHLCTRLGIPPSDIFLGMHVQLDNGSSAPVYSGTGAFVKFLPKVMDSYLQEVQQHRAGILDSAASRTAAILEGLRANLSEHELDGLSRDDGGALIRNWLKFLLEGTWPFGAWVDLTAACVG